MIEILDTAGQEEFMALRKQWMRDSEVFLLVYSINSKDSFEQLNSFVEQIKEVKSEDPYSMVLIGNKSDLEDQRKVTKEEAQSFANQNNFDFFIETSAKTAHNVEKAFVEACKLILFYDDVNVHYFTGKGIEKLFKLNNVNLSNIEIPNCNKNLKNVWLMILKMVFSKYDNKNERLNCKLVCKHWYDLVSNHFEKKVILKNFLIEKTHIFRISSIENPNIFLTYDKYIYVIDLLDHLKDISTKKEADFLNNLKFQKTNEKKKKKKIVVVIYNTKPFKNILENQEKSDPKKTVSNLVKEFSDFKVIEVEDLSKKNITTIFRKINFWKHKVILETLKLF